jgi:lysophospholipase L1-like esterase
MRLLQIFSILAFVVFIEQSLVAQPKDPTRFQNEVDSIVALNQSVDRANLILFTGSSSIRMWDKMKTAFPNYNVVNLGFGGSEMSDLLFYVDKLIISFAPKTVFIYEGDNDINFGRTTKDILSTADSILHRIRSKLPDTEIIFISPKPSLARWNLKEKYVTFNKQLEAWTHQKKRVRFADVWSPMLDSKGMVRKDIFIADGLHLNEKGYSIWTSALAKYLPANPR